MLLDIVFGSKSVWRILILLSENPGSSLTRPEIRKFTKLGNKAISLSLNNLLINDILIKRKGGKKTYYSLNLTNEFVKDILVLCKNENKCLNNLPYSFSLILREFTRQLIAEIDVKKVILFGSIAKRTFRNDSDIDVAIIIDKELDVKDKLLVTQITENIKLRFKKEIQPHYFILNEFEKGKDKLCEEIKRDGVSLL